LTGGEDAGALTSGEAAGALTSGVDAGALMGGVDAGALMGGVDAAQGAPERMIKLQSQDQPQHASPGGQAVKCLVWDLDDTLWDGVLLEDPEVTLRPRAIEILRTLDERGILHSIASRNDRALAMAKLRSFGIDEYFLYPQINWDSKAASIGRIARDLKFGLDHIAFIDDQPYERDEVAFSHPQVLCIDSAALAGLLDRPEMMPRFITADSRARRQMYLGDLERSRREAEFNGPTVEFLATLGMVFAIGPAGAGDLERAEELTVRTHQLNSTGVTYSAAELDAFRISPRHRLLITSLSDRYGTYGKVGLALIEREPGTWSIKLLLLSCRVMARGAGTVFLQHIMASARRAGVRLRADFVVTDRNRMMLITYQVAGFSEVARRGAVMVMENDLARIQPHPSYVQVRVEEEAV
jgi:FkbH-like protein